MRDEETSIGGEHDLIGIPPTEPAEFESVPTSVAEVESAGRSCLVILALGIVILLLLCVWIGVRSTAG